LITVPPSCGTLPSMRAPAPSRDARRQARQLYRPVRGTCAVFITAPAHHRVGIAMSEIIETELPGIGKRFKMDLKKGGTLSVVVRLDGMRDVYFRQQLEEEPSVFSMSELESKQVSQILVGTYYRMQPLEMLEEALEFKAGLHSVHVPRSTVVAGKRIGDLDVRKRTETSIVAVIRDDGTSIPNPDPSTAIERDDMLIVIGTAEGVDRLKAMLGG
jgi:TrkA domain protein